MMKMDKGNEFSNSGNFVGLSNRNRDSYQLLMDMDYDDNVSRSAEIFLDFAKCADKVFVKNGFGKGWVNDDPYVEPLENGAEFSFVKLTNENTGEKIEFVGKYVYGRFVNDDLSLSDFEYSGSFSVKYEGLSDESYQKLDGLLKSREFKNLYGMSYQKDAAWSSEINTLMDGMSDVPSRDELLGKEFEMDSDIWKKEFKEITDILDKHGMDLVRYKDDQNDVVIRDSGSRLMVSGYNAEQFMENFAAKVRSYDPVEMAYGDTAHEREMFGSDRNGIPYVNDRQTQDEYFKGSLDYFKKVQERFSGALQDLQDSLNKGKDSDIPLELDMSEIDQKFKDRANGKYTGKGSR